MTWHAAQPAACAAAAVPPPPRGAWHLRLGMTVLLRVTIPLMVTSLSMSAGSRSRICLMSSRRYGRHCGTARAQPRRKSVARQCQSSPVVAAHPASSPGWWLCRPAGQFLPWPILEHPRGRFGAPHALPPAQPPATRFHAFRQQRVLRGCVMHSSISSHMHMHMRANLAHQGADKEPQLAPPAPPAASTWRVLAGPPGPCQCLPATSHHQHTGTASPSSTPP